MKLLTLILHPIRSVRAAWRTREVAVLRSINELLAKENALLRERKLPAEFMQLRVHGMSVRQRTGYGVTAFIPEGVVDKIKSDAGMRAAFTKMVAESLVESAVSGLLNINSRDKVSAILFGDDACAKIVFDSDIDGYRMTDSTTTRKQICAKPKS